MVGRPGRSVAPSLVLLVGAGCRGSAPRAVDPTPPTRPMSPPIELVLERVVHIEITDDFEPSGLALEGEHLLTVSDKHDGTVYEIVQGEPNATLRTFVSFTAPSEVVGPLDFEGIVADPDGTLLVVSEAALRVLRVTVTGRATWITPSLASIGRRAGLFPKRNAGIEGIAHLPDGRLVLAAEREPRGLVELPAELANIETSPDTHVWAMPSSIYPVPMARDTDFSDLAVADGELYALERNSHLVVRLERTSDRWEEREAWSYARTENDPQLAYVDGRYGVAEGLAIDRDHVYVVTDNNRHARTADPTDVRPELFVFTRPR